MRGTHGQGPPRRYLPRASLAVAVPFLSVPCPRAPLPSLVLTVLLVWASDMEREEDGPQRMRNGRVENRPPLAGKEGGGGGGCIGIPRSLVDPDRAWMRRSPVCAPRPQQQQALPGPVRRVFLPGLAL